MKLFGVIGWKNAGKTTLVEKLVAELTRRGLRVSTIKHTHHGVDLDQPGRDTFRHREAGACEVILASSARTAILREVRGGPEPSLAELAARLSPVDVVIVEGFKAEGHPKIEVWRAACARDPIAGSDETVLAVATDAALPIETLGLDLNDPGSIADFVLDRLAEAAPLAELAAR